jgi:hypothetical protein
VPRQVPPHRTASLLPYEEPEPAAGGVAGAYCLEWAIVRVVPDFGRASVTERRRASAWAASGVVAACPVRGGSRILGLGRVRGMPSSVEGVTSEEMEQRFGAPEFTEAMEHRRRPETEILSRS